MAWLGLDIGGANIKVADGRGFAESFPFALWQAPQQLGLQLRTVIAQSPPCDHLAITMTGELADCYASKEEGVRAILDAVEEAGAGRHTRVYLTSGSLVTLPVARGRTAEVAAANWHALARFAGRFANQGTGILIDIGSTTTDIIPLHEGQVAAHGMTDTERLISGELVYLGVERTPVCAVADHVPYRGHRPSLARELFATLRDVFLVLDQMEESESDRNTADGRPATKAAARVRLGRMICADAEQFHHRDAVEMANSLARQVVQLLKADFQRVLARLATPPARVIMAGQGEFLARQLLPTLDSPLPPFSLNRELGTRVSRCAPAHALAVLARELSS